MLAASGSGAGGAAIAGIVLIGLYFVPTIVAVIRKVPNVPSRCEGASPLLACRWGSWVGGRSGSSSRC